jgi:hypothetical protein
VVREYLVSPFVGANLTNDQVLFNKRLSQVRIAVEWVFKDVKKYFSHVAFPRKMCIGKTPVGSWYVASALLWNFRCCLYGSPTATYFDCAAPSLEEYLQMME